MLKRLLLLSSLFFVLGAKAQVFKVGNFDIGFAYLGPKIGMNISSVSVQLSEGTDKAVNFGSQIGIVGKFGITESLAFQPELIYTSKGYSSVVSEFKTNYNYNYIGLPLIVHYSLMEIAGIKLAAEGGFYTDVLTQVRLSYGDGGESFSQDLNPYTRIDFGFDLGLSFEMPLYGNTLQGSFRYSQGIVDTYDDLIQSSNVNTTFQFSLTYFIDLLRVLRNKAS